MTSIPIPPPSPNAVANLKAATRIIRLICGEFNVTTEQLESRDRSDRLVAARWIAMYLIRHFTTMSTPKIGYLFSRDHTAVLLAIRCLPNRLSFDRLLARDFKRIAGKIQSSQQL